MEIFNAISEMMVAYYQDGVKGAMGVYDAIEDEKLRISVSREIEYNSLEGTIEEEIFEAICSW